MIPNLNNMLAQIKQNPMKVLGQRFNIPQGLTSPQQIVQHLMNSGQVSQDAFNRAYQMYSQLGAQGLDKE